MSATIHPRYVGHLRRNRETGIVEGEIVDCWGWRISLTARPDPAGGYVLEGVLGEPPESLLLPGDEGAAGHAGS